MSPHADGTDVCQRPPLHLFFLFSFFVYTTSLECGKQQIAGLRRRIYPDLLPLIPLSESHFCLGLCRFILKTWYQPTFTVTLLEFKLIAWTHGARFSPRFAHARDDFPLARFRVCADVPSFELIYWLIMGLLCMHAGALFVFSGVLRRAERRTDTDWWV